MIGNILNSTTNASDVYNQTIDLWEAGGAQIR